MFSTPPRTLIRSHRHRRLRFSVLFENFRAFREIVWTFTPSPMSACRASGSQGGSQFYLVSGSRSCVAAEMASVVGLWAPKRPFYSTRAATLYMAAPLARVDGRHARAKPIRHIDAVEESCGFARLRRGGTRRGPQ